MTEPHLNFETIFYPRELSDHNKRLMTEHVLLMAGMLGIGIIAGLLLGLVIYG